MSRAKTKLKRKKNNPKTSTRITGKNKVVKKKEEFTMPKWQDCTWKRIPCGEDICPICGQIKQTRMRHIARGVNPDSVEAVIEDVSKNFGETFAMLGEDAEKIGVDLDDNKDKDHEKGPEPHEFPLYNKILAWRNNIYDIADASGYTSSTWLFTEAGEDLLWYSSTLITKTYRQLSTRWEIDRGADDIDFEYKYTGGVLVKCLDYLKSALGELSKMEIEQNKQFNIALLCLYGFEKDLLEAVD